LEIEAGAKRRLADEYDADRARFAATAIGVIFLSRISL
jgi:hypothetical protein